VTLAIGIARRLAIVGLALMVLCGIASVVAPQAQALSPCTLIPGPASTACAIAGQSRIGPLGRVDSIASCVSDPIGCVAKSFASGAQWFMNKLGELITNTTQIDLTNSNFLNLYATVFGLAAILTLIRVLLAVTTSVIRGQGWEAVKSGTVYYVAAIALGAFAPAMGYLLLRLSDGLTTAVTFNTNADTSRAFTGLGKTLAGLSAGNVGGSATLLLVAVLAMIGAAVIWLELLVRTAALYVVILFAAPVASGLINRSTWPSVRRWVYFTVAIIMSKPAVGAVLALATTMLAHGSSKDAFSSVLTGIALMFMAIFATGLLFKFIPHVGDEIAHVTSARRELSSSGPAAAVPGPANIAQTSIQTHAASMTSRVGRPATATAGAAGGAALVGAQKVPAMAGKTATGTAAGTASRNGSGTNGRPHPPSESKGPQS
jgi:hypothetical protein